MSFACFRVRARVGIGVCQSTGGWHCAATAGDDAAVGGVAVEGDHSGYGARRVHPPLYFLMLRLWENLWGDSESAVRSLNVLFSLVSIWLLFWVASESIGATPALWACLLMAVGEPQIQFSQEARNYMPVTTFSLLAVWSIQKLRRGPGTLPAGVLTAALLAMMLTHYFAAGVAAGLAIYAVALLRGRARWFAVGSFTAAGILFLGLWGSSLLSQSPHFRSNYSWVSDVGPGHCRRVMTNFVRLPFRLVAELPQNTTLQIICDLSGAAFFGYLALMFVRRLELRIWILFFAGAVGIVFAVDLFRGTAQLALSSIFTVCHAGALCIAGCGGWSGTLAFAASRSGGVVGADEFAQCVYSSLENGFSNAGADRGASVRA